MVCTNYSHAVTKLWEKPLLEQFSVFCPLPSLKNVEKQSANLASIYVMAFQHCIGEEGDF